MEKHVIWQNRNLNLEDWREDLVEELRENGEDPDITEDKLYDLMVKTNDRYLDDDRMNLSKIVYNHPILIVAELGLWNGPTPGYNEVSSGKVSDCLYLTGSCEYGEFYVDQNGDLRCIADHHDGTNHYLYRVYKDGVSEEQKDKLKLKILNGTATRTDITKITKRLGDDIGAVFGWTFPHRGRHAGAGKSNAGKRMLQSILKADSIEDCKDVCLQLCKLCGFGKTFTEALDQGNVAVAEQSVIKAFNIWNVPYTRKEPFDPVNACYIAKAEERCAG